MRSKYYKEEENKGFIKTHYFRKIDTEKIDKKLISLENNFNGDDVYLDIVIHDKERNNFDFFLMRITESSSVNNSLDAWNHIDITNIYNYILYDNKYCSDIINEKKGYLILKLKYTNENNIITSYFKVHCRNTKWENDKKVWHIPLFYIFEMSKLTLFLGGTVSDTVLYYLCKLFHHFSSIKNVNSNAKMNELSKDQLIKTDEICDTTHKEKKNNDDDNTENYHNNNNNNNNQNNNNNNNNNIAVQVNCRKQDKFYPSNNDVIRNSSPKVVFGNKNDNNYKNVLHYDKNIPHGDNTMKDEVNILNHHVPVNHLHTQQKQGEDSCIENNKINNLQKNKNEEINVIEKDLTLKDNCDVLYKEKKIRNDDDRNYNTDEDTHYDNNDDTYYDDDNDDSCDNKNDDCVNKNDDCVNKSDDCVNKSADCVNKSADCVNKSDDCVNKSDDYVNKGDDCVNKSDDCVNKNDHCVNKNDHCDDKNNICDNKNDHCDNINDGYTNQENNASKDSNKNTTNEITFNLDIFIKENKLNFIEYIKNVRMFRIEHIIINNIVKGDTMYIKLIPYNEDIVTKIKQTNFIQWNRTENILLIKKSNFKNFYINIIKGFNFKLCSYYDYFKLFRQKIMENDCKSLKGNFSVTTNITLNTEYLSTKFNKRKMDFHNKEEEITDKGNVRKHSKKKKKNINGLGYESTDSCNSDELSNNVDSSYYEGRELVNKIKLVGAANNYYKEVIYNKLHKIKHLRPPNYTYDPKGLITKNGAGTKGIEIFDMPSDINEWNKISFCIVPNEKKDIDLYDPKILCSLVSDVYLLKEKALDIILKNYKKWPEYTDVFWNTVCSENEFIVCNKNFNTRQKLAHDRLFNKQYFYIFNMESIKHSNYYNPLFLCKVLITLGEGILVQHPYDAEYIIITNSNDFNAIQFYNYLHEKKKKKKKLPLFVTPKFIYDCILNYSISYPSKNKNHFAFSS
ncbi:hypothetical protein PRSY57_0103900 [Plasmodium reichenowi]|uniref:BRCT domain-containing protein n=1 Tax=Plasmodium reichenowi TaxID=5854 RepID=A0A151LW22_PLARE|nr:hypothetical protein PRSY57_0103900 [Plasmodium reichenowi]KYO03389.1 hypothetical protein PRSY57_0103900 [Plasmodium reichenowi]